MPIAPNDLLSVSVSVSNGSYSLSVSPSGDSIDLNGTIAVSPPASGCSILFDQDVTEGSNTASKGPYKDLSTLTSFKPTVTGNLGIQAGVPAGGSYCTAHTIPVSKVGRF